MKTNFKKKVLQKLMWDKQVDKYVTKFRSEHKGYAKEHPFRMISYISKLNKSQYQQLSLKKVSKPKYSYLYEASSSTDLQNFKYYEEDFVRIPPNQLYKKLCKYDVISFDIFDTLIYRKVEQPKDIFLIMSTEMRHNDFTNIRKKAENQAREAMFANKGTREVLLHDIYKVLEEKYGINPIWQNREIELELELSIVNPYMHQVYDRLQKAGKTIVLMSDMYLPKNVIEEMLRKNGYSGYNEFLLSNECNLRKGDGSLQQKLMSMFEGKKIIHVGDNEEADIAKTKSVGLNAFYNAAPNLTYKEPDLNSIAGSFYRATINSNMNNGLWKHSLHYDHGFRVGGILTVGFCNYLNSIMEQKQIDKILFCARDCDIIYKIYKEFYNQYDSEYIEISRYAIMNVLPDRYLYDIATRFVVRYAKEGGKTKTIADALKDTGYGYLVEYLEAYDIDPYLYCSALKLKTIENFILDHKAEIIQHNQPSIHAAKKYFEKVIGTAKSVLVVDVGWSGTCVSALEHFIDIYFPEKDCSVYGALMCTSRNNVLTNSISEGSMFSYVYSPFSNMDITRFMMPAKTPVRKQDLLHMPLEYMYTSTTKSLVAYREADNQVQFIRTGYSPANVEQISEMQQGLRDFVKIFKEHYDKYNFMISSYVAFRPLMESIKNEAYTYQVYKDFVYDACTAPYVDNSVMENFGNLFKTTNIITTQELSVSNNKTSILFITPELIYTGAPRSLLRMCKVAQTSGYQPYVWSAKPGPFIAEFAKYNIPVSIVTESDLTKEKYISSLSNYGMAICNTIVTDQYARVLSQYLPVVWYIREATNIPDFVRENDERMYTLQHSEDIYCVSDYAANAISKYTDKPIQVVHNSVEDETDMATDYIPGTGNTIKFVQFGTMEFRKGYDVLLAAYLSMPKEYQDKAELFFAGGFINSGTPYCSYLFSKMEGLKNVHYLSVVKGEEKKIRTLSKMDVVVVASRDESCSLVALEGAMLSKPLIVTENVGAKYIIKDGNGYIVNTADVESLKCAMMKMIDNKEQLAKMGVISRTNYEAMGSMESYTKDMKTMFAIADEPEKYQYKIKNARKVYSEKYIKKENNKLMKAKQKSNTEENVIVSLTSHPERITSIHYTIESLIHQNSKPKRIILFLSEEQFPKKNGNLPKELLCLLENSLFEIRWVKEDMKPHKKYLYLQEECKTTPLIIVDDDVIYDPNLVGNLMNSYRNFPDSISCMRANLMLFKPDNSFRKYENWIMDYRLLRNIPSYHLLPTGVGGVLYPPKSIPEEAYNRQAIEKTCLLCDDLWLKIMTAKNGYRTVVPQDICEYEVIEGTQDSALWLQNVRRNNNDDCMDKILEFLSKEEDIRILLENLRKDRFC